MRKGRCEAVGLCVALSVACGKRERGILRECFMKRDIAHPFIT